MALKKDMTAQLLAALNGAVRNMVVMHRPGALQQNLTVNVAEISISPKNLAHALRTLPKNVQGIVFEALDKYLRPKTESSLAPSTLQ